MSKMHEWFRGILRQVRKKNYDPLWSWRNGNMICEVVFFGPTEIVGVVIDQYMDAGQLYNAVAVPDDQVHRVLASECWRWHGDIPRRKDTPK